MMKNDTKKINNKIGHEIKNNLIELSEQSHKKFNMKLTPNVNNILGIRSNKLKKYAEELVKDKDEFEIEALINNIENDYAEEKILKGILISLNKGQDILKKLSDIEKLVPQIDSWLVCDSIVSSFKFTKTNKEIVYDFIQKYLKSDKEYEIRFALVMILSYYIEDNYMKNNFKIFRNVRSDKYYVQMALAWAISKSFVKFYNDTLEFIKAANLNKFVKNKAIQKARESLCIDNEKKEYLKTLKI